MKDNVVSLDARREKWDVSYVSPEGDLRIRTSSHGRVSFQLGSKGVILEFMDSVSMLSSVSEHMSFALEPLYKKERSENAKQGPQ